MREASDSRSNDSEALALKLCGDVEASIVPEKTLSGLQNGLPEGADRAAARSSANSEDLEECRGPGLAERNAGGSTSSDGAGLNNSSTASLARFSLHVSSAASLLYL